MPNVKFKSDENLEAAHILRQNNKLSASIHCYYYSILQLSMYALNTCCGMTYLKQEQECDKLKSNSHNFIITNITDNFKDSDEYSEFWSNFAQLKKFRLMADYKNSRIGAKIANKSELLSEKLSAILVNKFNIK